MFYGFLFIFLIPKINILPKELNKVIKHIDLERSGKKIILAHGKFFSYKEITIDIKNAYWDTILRQVKKLTEIKETDDIKTKKKKNRYQSFYNRLDAVRVAWRNPTMHPKTTYTQEEAKEILDAVRLFVTDFSTLR